ncbi:MAG: autoinducer binding domain-containing protein [Gammaproteobacteria bacterium]
MADKKLIIVNPDSKIYRYNDRNCSNTYSDISASIGCTYLIYMYENLFSNEKFIYSSNWDWQNLLIGNKLINHCPIFLAAFNYLEKRTKGQILIPWHLSPPSSKEERNVCGLRSEFNIANGFGYGAKGNGIRETLAFAGDNKDHSFYKNFISNPQLFNEILYKMRLNVLYKNHENKMLANIINTKFN